MESRLNNIDYNDDNQPTRSSRNARLYREVYGKYGELDNLPIADNTNEIDMDSLKELISNLDKKEEKEIQTDIDLDILNTRKRNIDENKVYDINKLLEKAKYENSKLKEPENELLHTSRNILSKLSKEDIDINKLKSKYQDIKTEEVKEEDTTNNKKENDLSMTREMKYHTKQISVDPLIEQVMPDNDLAMDLFEDLKPTGDTIVTKPIKEKKTKTIKDKKKKEIDEDNSDIDIIKKDNKIDSDFFTSSYKFSEKDFTDDEMFEDSKTGNVLKILLLILAIIVFAGVIFYFVMHFGLGA